MIPKFNMTVELTPEQIKEAIAQYVKQEMKSDVGPFKKDVQLVVTTRLEGMGSMERDVPVLDKAIVTIKNPGPRQTW